MTGHHGFSNNNPPSAPSNDTESRLFCFGYGYTAEYLVHALNAQNEASINSAPVWAVSGTTRDPDKCESLCNRGVNAFIFNYKHPLPAAGKTLENITHLLISTPPDDNGDPCFNIHAHDIADMPNLKWLGYLSTTSVYGNRDGAWVDESSRPRPTSQRGSRRLLAEEQWLSLYENYGVPVHIFRLSGIYGPKRSALDTVRAGIARRIDKPGQKFSRIHVEDIAQILIASVGRPNAGAIYNVADDDPAPSHEIIKYACDLLGMRPPPLIDYEQADLAPMARSFYADNKRIKNERIKNELAVSLKYPTYKDGLKACLKEENKPSQSLFSGMMAG